MTERKKPGPKPKCKECGRKEGEGHYDDCSVGMGVIPKWDVAPTGGFIPLPGAIDGAAPPAVRHEWDVIHRMPDMHDAAQAYAMRVWNGQSPDVPRKERIARCIRALEGQNLPTEGVEYPQ